MITILNLYKDWSENSSLNKLLIENDFVISLLYFKKISPRKIKSKVFLVLINIYIVPKIILNYIKFTKTSYILGFHLPFFFIARFFKKMDDNVIIDNFYLHEIGENKRFQQILKWLLKNKKYRFIVQSEYEVNYYKNISSTIKISFIPYAMGKIKLSSTSTLPIDLPLNYIFTGGYTNRDYDLVLKSAKQYPNFNFVIVMTILNNIKTEIPKNVIIYKDLISDDFNLILSKSDCVLVPLKSRVGSSGQMLCLTAMQLGKLIIYSVNSSINQYFLNNKNGIPFVMNDLTSLNKALNEYSNISDEEKRIIKEIQIKTFKKNFSIEIRNQLILNIIFNIHNEFKNK